MRYLVETFEAAEAANNQNYRTLLDFSLGRIDDRATMAALGIDSEEDLFLLMAQAHLPMPRLPAATTQDRVVEWVGESSIPILPTRTCQRYLTAQAGRG